MNLFLLGYLLWIILAGLFWYGWKKSRKRPANIEGFSLDNIGKSEKSTTDADEREASAYEPGAISRTSALLWHLFLYPVVALILNLYLAKGNINQVIILPEKKERNDYGSYMHDYISKIVDTYGPRAPGSTEETEAGKNILEEMKNSADEVDREKFSCHPRAFLGWIKITVPFYIMGVLIYFLLPEYMWISIILSGFGLLLFFEQFLQYAEFIDPLFPEETSYNIIGRFEPEGETNKTLIFSGHHDSAYQFNLIAWFPSVYPILMGIAFIGLITFPFVVSVNFIIGSLSLNLSLISTIFSIVPWTYLATFPFTALFFLFETGKPVPGASDNLSAVGVILGLAKYLNEIQGSEEYPQNTEVLCVSFGCEEAGLRGSRRYVEKHLEELKKKDVEVINLETLTDPDELSIFKRENTTRTNHSMELARKVKNIAQEKLDIDLPFEDLSIGGGGTDATPFSRENISAISIFGTDMEGVPEFYHTMDDTPDKVDPQALTRTLEICKEVIKSSEGSGQG